MTAAAETSNPSVWRGRGIWIALALSVTLNVFFLGGLVWSMMAPPPAPPQDFAQRLGSAARGLDLSPDQRKAFRSFAVAARDIRGELRSSNAPLMRGIWDEMAKPQPDTALIAKLGDQALENRREFQRKMSSNLLTFLATLSPDQRKRFTEMAVSREQRREAPPQH